VTSVASGRPYRGVPPEERAAARRDRLLAAALELYGRRGHARPTIAQVCARAQVTTRNFYEAFGSREDLLLALYDRLLHGQAQRLSAAFAGIDPTTPIRDQAQALIESFVRPWAEDVRKARVAQLEIRGVSAEIDARQLEALHGFAALIAEHTGVSRWHAIGIVGAVTQTLLIWHTMSDTERPPIEDVIAALADVAARTLAG
jgi:AcrR family transcriptional regulator